MTAIAGSSISGASSIAAIARVQHSRVQGQRAVYKHQRDGRATATSAGIAAISTIASGTTVSACPSSTGAGIQADPAISARTTGATVSSATTVTSTTGS